MRAAFRRRCSPRRVLGSLFLMAAAYAPPLVAQPGEVPAGGKDNSNCFPFGCVVAENASTRYQQLYAATHFPGALRFNTIAFFTDPMHQNWLNMGTFRIYLSTTRVSVDGLNPGNLDANVGPAPFLFGTFTIGGDAPAVLAFTGATYDYDPAAGNLLLDLRVDGMFTSTSSPAAFVGSNGSADGVYSRVTDFGDGEMGYGLDTQFSLVPTAVPEPTPWALLGVGLSAIGAVRTRSRRR